MAKDNSDLYDEDLTALVERAIERLEKIQDIILERTAPRDLAQWERELQDQESE